MGNQFIRSGFSEPNDTFQMIQNVYIFFARFQKVKAYPTDQTLDYIEEALRRAKNNAQIVLMRRDNLLHYCYIRKINPSQHFGICWRSSNICLEVNKLFSCFDNVLSDIVQEGTLLQMDKEGNVQLTETSLTTESVAIQQISDKLLQKISLLSISSKPLPPTDFSISINDCLEVSLDECRKLELTEYTKKYSNLYIVRKKDDIARLTAMSNLIKDKESRITRLQETILQQDNVISELKKAKNKYRWVVTLIILLAACITLFLIVSKYNSDIIETIINENQQLSEINETYLKRIQQDSTHLVEDSFRIVGLEQNIVRLQNSFDSVENIVNHYSAAFCSPYCLYFPEWHSTNHTPNSQLSVSYSFYAFEGSIVTIPYYVSSEQSYDNLIITITKGEDPPQEIVHVSGTKNNTHTYICPESNFYKIIIKYQKDGSIDKNDDKGGVNKIRLEHIRNL